MRRFGPGLLVTAAFIGPGSIATASVAGANFGFVLLWALLFSLMLLLGGVGALKPFKNHSKPYSN